MNKFPNPASPVFHRIFIVPFLLVTLLVLAACSQELHHGLNEEQANEILVTLDRNGIHASKLTEEGGEEPTFAISVPARDSAKAWQIMRDNDLPKPAKKGFNEVYGKTSLIPTAMEEKAMFLQAICGELSKTIEAIHGVVDARVHVVLPDQDVLKTELQGPTTPKAAVLIKYRIDRNGNAPFRHDDIRSLVANSVEGLKPTDVSVVSSQVAGDVRPEMVYFGPHLKVARDSVFPFQLYLTGLVVVFLIVGLMLLMSARNSMSLRKEVARLRMSGAGRQISKLEK